MSNPTNAVWPLADDLDGQDQSGPVSFSGVDPIRFPDGLLLEDASTNYVRNPMASVDASSNMGAGSGSITITRLTGQSIELPTGEIVTTCFEFEWTGTPSTNAAYWNLGGFSYAQGTPYAAQYFVKGLGGSIGRTLKFGLYETGGGSGNGYASTDTHVMTDDWTQAIVTGSIQAADRTGGFLLLQEVGAVLGEKFQIVAVQNEQRAYPTLPFSGDSGDGFAWGGTPGNSASTRAASSASLSPAGILSPSSGAIAFRITPTIETGLEELWGECGTKGSGTDHLRWGRDSSKHPFVEWSSNDASYQRLTASETWNALVAKTLYLGWDSTTAYLQVDSGTLQTHARDAVSASWGAGNLKLQASKGGNIVTPFSAYSEHLNDTDRALVIAAIAAGGSNLATVLDDAAAPLRTMNIRTNALLRQ